LRWRLTDGATTRIGEAALNDLPRGADVELIVPASRVLLTRIKLPPGNPQRLGEVASYAVEDKLLGDPDTIHAAVGSRGADGTTTAAIVDRAWLTSVQNQFSTAGRQPIRAVSEIATVPVSPDSWNVIWHGNQGWLRTIEDQGLVVDSADQGAPLALLLALQEARAINAVPERIIVHAAEDHALPVLARWEQELGVPIEAGPPWTWQRIDAPLKHGINLLQGPFAPSRSGAELLQHYRVPVFLAAGILGLYLIVGIVDWAWLKWQEHSLKTQMIEAFKTAFPDAKTIVDAPLQMQRNVADLKRAHGEAQPEDFLPLLANALPAISTTGGTTQALQYERGKLRLDLRLSQAQPPEVLNQQLSGAGIQAKVESVNPTAGGVLARITITGRKI
jgi:general secretion pathway protein L